MKNIKELMKNKLIIYLSTVVGLMLIMGISFAYFNLVVSGNEEAKKMTVDTTTLELKYTDGNEVKAEDIEPGWTMNKTITIENTGNETVYYTLGWQKLYNEIQKDELVIRSTCISDGVENGTCDNTNDVVVPQTIEVTAETNKLLYPYKEGVKILSGETHTYKVTVEFINYTDVLQNYNQGKDFYGVLGVVEAYNTYNLTLNIKDTDGNAVKNSEVTMHSTPRTGMTDENGTVVFNNVEIGDHTLLVNNNGTELTSNFNLTSGKGIISKTDNLVNVKTENKNIELDVTLNGKVVSDVSIKSKFYDLCKNKTLASCLVDNYELAKLTKIEHTATGNQGYATTDYRYQGGEGCLQMTSDVCTSAGGAHSDSSTCWDESWNVIKVSKEDCIKNGEIWNDNFPNNYITFNGETGVWRIIGVFEVETPNGDGTYIKEYKVKIVRDTIGTSAWNEVQTNGKPWTDWTTATLMTTLNSGDYYNRTGVYESNGLTTEAKNQISSTKWYLGNIPWWNGHGNTKALYQLERSTSVTSGNSQTWDGKVALIYPSDYTYASSACYNDDTKKAWDSGISDPYSTDYRYIKCKSTNWLFSGIFNWSLSPHTYSGKIALHFSATGFVSHSEVNTVWNVKPTLYLSSNVIFKDGDGTVEKPFEIK